MNNATAVRCATTGPRGRAWRQQPWISGDKDQVMEPGLCATSGGPPYHDYQEISSCSHLAMREQPDQLRRMLIE